MFHIMQDLQLNLCHLLGQHDHSRRKRLYVWVWHIAMFQIPSNTYNWITFFFQGNMIIPDAKAYMFGPTHHCHVSKSEQHLQLDFFRDIITFVDALACMCYPHLNFGQNLQLALLLHFGEM